MIEPCDVKYWNGSARNGIKVDWQLVRNNFKKIVPKKYHYLIDYPFEKYAYNFWVSERAGNKTTQIQLLGLIVYQMYGVQLEYVRESEDYTTPKALSTLYNPIIESGYLEKIFGDQWNDIQYRGGYFRLVHRGEDGKADAVASDYITHVIANDKPDNYKSSYSTVRGDFVFFDEYIGIRARPYVHKYFKQNLATVLRKRKHAVIMLAANNINFNSDVYADFRIRRDIRKLDPAGDEAEIEKNGTRFFFRILPPDRSADKQQFNKKYFGYAEGGSTAAITGGSWETEDFPHIDPEWSKCRPLVRNYYISHLGDLLRLTICKPPDMGTIVLVTPATRIYEDSRIFTVGEIRDKRYIYKCGSSSAGYAIFWKLYQRNKWYYAHNEAGELVSAFVQAASMK